MSAVKVYGGFDSGRGQVPKSTDIAHGEILEALEMLLTGAKAVRDSLTKIHGRITSSLRRIEDLEPKLEDMQKEVVALPQKIKGLRQEVPSLQENQHTLKDNVDLQQESERKELAWESEKLQLLQSNQDLQADREKLLQDITTVQQKNEYLKQQLEEVKRTAVTEKGTLQRKITKLENQIRDPKCQKTQCRNNRELLRKGTLAAAYSGNTHNPARNLEKTTGGNYDDAFEEFEVYFTNPDGLQEVLDKNLGYLESKQLLCKIFQSTYDAVRSTVLHRMSETLQCLFTVERSKHRENMQEIGRIHGLLLHASGLKSERVINEITSEVTTMVHDEFKGIGSYLEKHHLEQAVEIAYTFVTFPNPVVVCQPIIFDPKVHDPEFHYWNESSEAELVYTKPVVYRCYDGELECKGTVTNTVTTKEKDQHSTASAKKPEKKPTKVEEQYERSTFPTQGAEAVHPKEGKDDMSAQEKPSTPTPTQGWFQTSVNALRDLKIL